MTTFSKEVVGKSTWMLPLELSCIDDGNKGIVASKDATTWRFQTKEIKTWKGPPSFSAIGNDKGEITSVAIGEGNATFNSIGNHNPPSFECEDFDEPSPSKGKGIESHTNHSGFTFPTFLLLAKYCNNVSLDFVFVLVKDFRDLRFMVCPMHAHNAHTTCTTTSKWKVMVCNH